MHVRLSEPKFRNTTRVPSAFLREVVRFCAPGGCGPVRIWFKRCRRGNWFSGRCYAGRYVTCKIPDPYLLRAIYHTPAKNGYMDWEACTFEEALVALVAHELRHIWQYRNPRGRRVWGSRGRMSERDADAYAIRKMREWRRAQPSRALVVMKAAA
ncbi:hypothetical protein [Oleiharenicola sp. Vm1]|uniref:hypothetical protein n=1 Tax=Oleiharenicola sp. Vm1 TaxID=3398393 RepID=UPI0039F5B157